jgi:hypothetical protein
MTKASAACLLILTMLFARTAPAAEQSFELTIRDNAVPSAARVLRVQKNDRVVLRLTSDAPGELHLHGYRLEAKLAPGTARELAFDAYATGRYRLEWHPAAGKRSDARGHHGPPLATLEVRPQ